MGGKEAGWSHFAAADWAAARDSFAAVLEEHPGDPEALDGLGQSLWWLGERDAGIDRRREAYAAYRRRGDDAAQAGSPRTARASTGSTARTRRPRAGSQERGGCSPGPARCQSRAGSRSRTRCAPADPVEAERHCRAALALAEAVADPDVECMALAQLGRALVRQGRVEKGVALLDEAMAIALGGETSDPL